MHPHLPLLPLLLVVSLPTTRAADPPPANEGTLTLVNDPAFNRLHLTLAVPDAGSDSDVTTITGNLQARLAINPATGRSPEFTILGGTVSGTPVAFLIQVRFLWFTITVVNVASSTLGGTVFTTTPPGTIDPLTDVNDAAQHQFTINQGTVTGATYNPTTNVTSQVNVDFAATPIPGTGSGTGTVTITPVSNSATRAYFNITAVVPVNLSQPIQDEAGTTANLTATGTIKAAGQVSVPLSEYLAWTEAQQIPGADPAADPNADGIPNGLLWALGLGLTDDPRPHLLGSDPLAARGFSFTLPAGGSGGPLWIESSTSLAPASWAPAGTDELSPPVNPLPAGTSGTIIIAPSAAPTRYLRLRAQP